MFSIVKNVTFLLLERFSSLIKNDDEEDEKWNIDLVPDVCIEGANGNQNHCIGTSGDLGVIIVLPAFKKILAND